MQNQKLYFMKYDKYKLESTYLLFDLRNDESKDCANYPMRWSSDNELCYFGSEVDALCGLNFDKMYFYALPVSECTQSIITEFKSLIDKHINNGLIEVPITDSEDNILSKYDWVVLLDIDGITCDEFEHKKGDVLQFIGGVDGNLADFLHWPTNMPTGIFADRTLKLNR